MSERVKLEASDGHEVEAYVAVPSGEPLAGLVIVQEIFGVNRHIRSVAVNFARHGFLAVAPALFDRIERDIELDYQGADMRRAMVLARKLDLGNALKDVDAALHYARQHTGKPTGVVGYCYGGTLAWLSATRLAPAAVVGYYGGNIAKFAEEKPRVPVMLHFGMKDTHTPKEDVERIAKAHPEVEIYWYAAGHGFNCDVRSSYNEQAAQEAFDRTLSFLKNHLQEQIAGN